MNISKPERIFYVLGWIGLGCGIATALFLNSGALDSIHGRDLCAFHRVTGYYCPGCGITRACFALASGQVVKSLLYHPVPLYLLGLYVTWMGFITYRIVSTHTGRESQDQKNRLFYRRFEIAIYVMVAILLLQWVIKLLLQMIFHIDWFVFLAGIL
ncbi:MAG: DUF2752 domain-containing protein [Lachnospiraceae bacterium]|nr:DUF2752 domain-containing protein [Lachnospiraceae bacterium]